MVGSGRVLNRWNALTVEQKLSVGVLGVACLAAFTFGVVQVRASLLRPFTTDVQTLVELKKSMGPSDEELAEKAKKTDTDGDGISDFSESTVYNTSPYVRDSDSDGIADNLEIAQGTDPNCAKGKTCFSSSDTAAATGTTPMVPTGPQAGTGPFGSTGGSNPQPPTSRDPKQIRVYLEAIGISKAELASYSDAQILEAYDETVKQFEEGTPPASADTTP